MERELLCLEACRRGRFSGWESSSGGVGHCERMIGIVGHKADVAHDARRAVGVVRCVLVRFHVLVSDVVGEFVQIDLSLDVHLAVVRVHALRDGDRHDRDPVASTINEFVDRAGFLVRVEAVVEDHRRWRDAAVGVVAVDLPILGEHRRVEDDASLVWRNSLFAKIDGDLHALGRRFAIHRLHEHRRPAARWSTDTDRRAIRRRRP